LGENEAPNIIQLVLPLFLPKNDKSKCNHNEECLPEITVFIKQNITFSSRK